MLANGDVFAGYVIDRQLGRGGMGSVYLAKHPRLPRMTALKLLNREMFFDKEVRARFEREADLVARLDHPSIVTVYDRGLEDEQLWISMQYIDGIDAASVDPQRLPSERAVQIIQETAEALDYAHGMGVLHRDVKPANILLARSTGGRGERVYLTDFGIARLRDDTGHLTQTGTFTATLAYASPEQLTGASLDHRSDQYSLACSLFWLFTGNGPFTATNPAAVIQGHLQSPPPALSTVRPGLPIALDAVLAKAMAKRPDDRFGSCAEFAAAAKQALSNQSSPALPVTPPYTSGGHQQPYPSGGHQQPYPSGAQAQPYPSGAQAQPYPSGAQAQPYPSGLQAQPYPSGTQAQPYPSGLQSQPQAGGAQQQSPAGVAQPFAGGAPGQPYPSAAPTAPNQGNIGGPGVGPYQQQPAYPYNQPPPPQGSTKNTGLIIGLCLGLVVLVAVGIGIVVAIGGDDSSSTADGSSTSTSASSTAASVPATLDSLSKEFPGMVPATTSGDVGYNAANCWNASSDSPPSPDAGEPDFGTWTYQWRCYGGNNNDDPFYRFYVYESAADVEAVVQSLSGAQKSTDSNGGQTYTNYKLEKDSPMMITVFTGDPNRAQFLMFTDGVVGTIDEVLTWWKSAPLN
ncbi:serine/threonine protein kinase [Nocardia donostiensis]|uniref:non-specific serine/threonine protein kinase n=2 Tax=Nocardia donostiensis TaxID=1538463 RepID=A0A1W0B8U0_9NOCA|nr:serine/threonine-protein kinase [Nocardia donostiensis]ONM50723.1 serine/threonine protein kinase [Nocardia donostiensis]OQS18945.1 serine/threonine protein kinase [Nocardia donostiensis]